MQSLITDRKLGVEIECVAPIIGRGDNTDVQELLARVLSNHGMPAISRPYGHLSIPQGCLFAVEHDSSLRDESKYQGLIWSKIELKTAPIAWHELERVLPTAMDIVNYFGARINASCGLHVHHHLPEVLDRPQVVRSLQHLWWRFHKVMYGVVAPSRKDNTYCFAPRAEDARLYDNCTTYRKLCEKLSRAHRYSGMNLTNLTNRERLTVEWRIHQGTTDAVKIKNWILATQRWTEHAVARSCHHRPEPMLNTREGFNALLVTTGLKSNSRIYSKIDKDLRLVGKYLLRRWKQFNLPEQSKTGRTVKVITAAA